MVLCRLSFSPVREAVKGSALGFSLLSDLVVELDQAWCCPASLPATIYLIYFFDLFLKFF